ncbi:MAG: hypothetical protein RMK29_01830 [Myxococcales bacterium]|nr:hypothetical protein [Myxococcota bacterium]MDW8280420.1 hypothetical protein [Myxococcales bacterium]
MFPRLPWVVVVCALLSCDGLGQGQNRGGTGLAEDEIPLRVRRRCPGEPGCAPLGDGKLYVGVAVRDITPQVEPFEDTNDNGVYDPGERFEDRNGNGSFDAYWLAGFAPGRLARGVHDPVWARALALRQNQTTVVLVAVDAIGLFRDEEEEVRRLLPAEAEVDLLLIHATHNHQSVDLIGTWGPSPMQRGVHDGYQNQVRRAMAAATVEALRTARPAQVTFGAIAVEDPGGEMGRYVADTRDPVVIDNVLHTMQFREAQGRGQPIATLINWANHPEAVGSHNRLISSDFVHYLRERVEQRGGGRVIYVSGALGGLLTPLPVEPLDEDRRPVRDSGFAKAEALGRAVADFALQAMTDPAAITLDGHQLTLSFRDTRFAVRLDNRRYHLAAGLGLFRRSLCCYDPMLPIGEDNLPWIETQLAYLRLGPAAIITNPGELAPELLLGGYDGRHAGTYRLLDPNQPNAPELGRAPRPPYLIDLMDGERPHRQTWGLTGDFVGPILPRFNFVLDADAPYLRAAPGDHDEEMHSLGPLAEPQIVGTMRQLILDGRDGPDRRSP